MTTYKDDIARTASTDRRRLTLAEILEIFAAGDELPLKFTAYDGSSRGPDDAALGLDLHTPRGTTYLATAPGDLGLARAYVSGDLELHGVHPGDPYELLRAMADELDFKRPPARVLANIVRSSASSTSSRSPRRRRRRCRAGAASRKGCGTARLVTPRRSTTTTTSRTRSTSGCSDRR